MELAFILLLQLEIVAYVNISIKGASTATRKPLTLISTHAGFSNSSKRIKNRGGIVTTHINDASEKATIISDDYDKISKLEWQDELILLKTRLDLAEKERLAGTPGYSLEEVRNKLMEKFKNADGGIK